MRRKPRGPREKETGEQERAQTRTLTLNILKALSEGNRIFPHHSLTASGEHVIRRHVLWGRPLPPATLVFLQVNDCGDLYRNEYNMIMY